MKSLVLLLIGLPLFAATLTIDCGSSTDQFFTGGYTYTIQPAADTTLRFGTSFSYAVPAQNVPYVVTLHFLEPSNLPPARVFSVTINDQVVLARVTTPAYLAPFSRSVMVSASDSFIVIRFDTIVRSAVVSSIDITPLFEIFNVSAGFGLIQAKCVRCHGGDIVLGDTHLVAGLDLRTRTSMLVGGDRGPALIPGKPAESLIYRFVSHPQFPSATPAEIQTLTRSSDDSLAMPPFDPLAAAQIQIIRDWIAAGAPRWEPR